MPKIHNFIIKVLIIVYRVSGHLFKVKIQILEANLFIRFLLSFFVTYFLGGENF